jgi:hypothetical protein
VFDFISIILCLLLEHAVIIHMSFHISILAEGHGASICVTFEGLLFVVGAHVVIELAEIVKSTDANLITDFVTCLTLDNTPDGPLIHSVWDFDPVKYEVFAFGDKSLEPE